MHRCKPIAIWKLTAFHYGSTPKGSPKTTAFTLPLPFITLPVMYFTLTMLTADTFLLPYLPEFLLTFRLIVIPVVKCAKFHVPKIQNTGYIYGQSFYANMSPVFFNSRKEKLTRAGINHILGKYAAMARNQDKTL